MTLLVWLTIATLVVGAAGFLVGIRVFNPGERLQFFIVLADMALLVWGFISLGVMGIGIFVGASTLAFFGHAMHQTINVDRILTYGAIQAGATRREMKALHKRLLHSPDTQTAFAAIGGSIKTAQLLNQLAQRNRSISEIEEMAHPLAQALFVHDLDLPTFVDKVDRLLRLYGEPASRTGHALDVLTTGAQNSAATFEEMLDAAITAVDFAA